MIKYSVKKPLTVFVSIILVFVLGAVSFMGLSTDLLPAIELPYVVVVTTYPGASPERVEVSVTEPIEQSVATISGLENITSTSSENVSMVMLEFNDSVNMDSIMIDLNNSIQMVSGYFDDMVQAPMILKINPDMLPIQTVSVDVEGMDLKELTYYVETELQPYFERISGVATVEVSGAVADYVEIALNQDKIDAINDSILENLDSELLDQRSELYSAQNELNDGINTLNSERDSAFSQLANAQAELDSAIAQVQAIASQQASIEAQIGLRDGATEMIAARDGLSGLLLSVDTLINNPAFAAFGITENNTFQEVFNMAAVDATGTLAPIVAPFQGMVSVNQLDANTTLLAFKTQTQASIDAMNKELDAMGFDSSKDSATLTGEIATQKLELEDALVEATYLATQMESTITQLQTGYAQAQAAQASAVATIGSQMAQLDIAKQELEMGLEEFEKARDDALKQANIDSLVTQSTLAGILTAQNFSMPAGYTENEGEKLSVKIGEEFTNIEELQNLLLIDMGIDGVEPIHLGDVADISIQDNASDSYTRINGNAGVMISIQKSSIASTTQVTDAVNEAVAELMQENPDVNITTLMDQGVYINMIISSVLQNLVYGGIIAFIILLLFLKDLRPTLIIAFSIPISVLFSIVLMYFTNVTLNIISLSGLALGVGMLVDNSVVVIENIYRLRSEGYSKVQAAVIGAKGVGGAIFSSTLTTVSVFLPIVFTDGLTRQLFQDMGLTIAYSLFASLLVALTLVPAMASTMLNSTKQKEQKLFDKMLNVYEKALAFNLKHKWIVLVLTISLLALSIFNAFSMPLTLIPEMDSTEMQMSFTMDEETPKEEVIEHAEKIATTVSGIQGVDTVAMTMSSAASSMGMGALGGGGSDNNVNYYITIDPESGVTNFDVTEEIKALTSEYEENLSITASNMDLSALSGTGITYEIKGNDLDVLAQTASEIGEIAKGVEGVGEVNDGNSDVQEEIRIDVNKYEAMEHSLTVAQVFQLVNEALIEETTATALTFEGKELDAIIVPDGVVDYQELSQLEVATFINDDDEEEAVLLKDIATIYSAQTPQSIARDNQSRTQTVNVYMEDGYNVSLVGRELELALQDYVMPTGYALEVTGENEMIESTMADMFLMIGLAIIFIYLIMVAQFQSLLSPFIIIFTIPLAFTGGLLALQILGMELSITGLIGFLVLSGVVVNNGIVFVDYVNQLRLEGVDKTQALIKAGRDRMRPILMTALTTILAMSTMALGVGMGAQLSQGMSIVTIGGLSYATLLTLFLVPTLYDILHKKPINKIDVDFEVE